MEQLVGLAELRGRRVSGALRSAGRAAPAEHGSAARLLRLRRRTGRAKVQVGDRVLGAHHQIAATVVAGEALVPVRGALRCYDLRDHPPGAGGIAGVVAQVVRQIDHGAKDLPEPLLQRSSGEEAGWRAAPATGSRSRSCGRRRAVLPALPPPLPWTRRQSYCVGGRTAFSSLKPQSGWPKPLALTPLASRS